MDILIRRKLDMAARVLEFVRAQAATIPDYVPVLPKFEELVRRAAGVATRQHEGQVAARGARAHRRELRRVLHTQLVRFLVAVGSVANEDQAELAERFKLPATHANTASFLTSVKALLATAAMERELLVREGMSPTLLEDLERMVSEFETASEVQRKARRDHMGARVDLNVVAAELAKQLKVLDGIARYRFGSDPEKTAEWKAAKRILGQPRSGDKPAAEGSGGKQAA